MLHFAAAIGGGAGIAAQRIHRSLLEHGIESRFYYRWGSPPDDSFELLNWWEKSKWRNLIRPGVVALETWQYLAGLGRPKDQPPFSASWVGISTPPPPFNERTVIHLHWLSKTLGLPGFLGAIPAKTPIVWTLHDMNPLTGGCHYANGCERFTAQCRPCPQLPGRGVPELALRSQEAKRRSLLGKNLHVVADSCWLEAQARRSSVFRGASSFRTIHYGVESDVFSPQPKLDARRRLGLPERPLIIGFGADAVSARWKGFPELLEALQLLETKGVELVTFGRAGKGLAGLPLPHHPVGFVADRAELARVYSAMDVFVIPSLQEAFGQTALEAIACGVPVVGFETGGIPDTVRHGKTGLTVPTGDVRALARAIDHLLRDPNMRARMGATGRALAVSEFTISLQGERYASLYEEAFQAGE